MATHPSINSMLLLFLLAPGCVLGDFTVISPAPRGSSSSEWPCGLSAYDSRVGRTHIARVNNHISIQLYGQTSLSVILGLGPSDEGANFDFSTVMTAKTIDAIGTGNLCFPIADLTWVANGTIGVLQIIGDDNYSCSDVVFDTDAEGLVPTGSCNSTAVTANFINDSLLLANGSDAVAGSVSRMAMPPGTSPTSTGTGTVSTATDSRSDLIRLSSSGLSTGAKIGIGVAIALAVIVTSIILSLFLRHRRQRPRPSDIPTFPETLPGSGEKPELQGSAYDPRIAGLVGVKSELPAGQPHSNIEGKICLFVTHSELPNSVDTTTPWAHPYNEYLPVELVSELETAEVEAAPSSGRDGSRAVVASSTLSQSNEATQVSLPISVTRTPVEERDLLQGTGNVNSIKDVDSFVGEVDLLVHEFRLTQMRKKALNTVAAVHRVQPEDLLGSRGGDYKDLV